MDRHFRGRDLEDLAYRRRADRLIFTRWALVVYNFEKALREDPDRDDRNHLWWDLVERIQPTGEPLSAGHFVRSLA